VRDADIQVYDSVTTLLHGETDPTRSRAWGADIIAASHGGRYAAYLAAKAGVKGVVLNDAGIGRDQAGVAGLALLDDCHIAGAVVSYKSARIGDGADCAKRGRISVANRLATALGVHPGMSAMEAARLMLEGDNQPISPAALAAETRTLLTPAGARRKLVLADSVSLACADDVDAIVITGSHGGLQGADPSTAIGGHAVFAAAYNDAGLGADDAGISRLPALQLQGVAAVTVASDSARIGDARSTYEDGIISCVNSLAAAHGACVGIPLKGLVERWLAIRI
jgi:hypothetical protein